MTEFQVLGALELRGPDGASALAVLSRPKRAALLTYLALTASDRYVSRDRVLSVLWPTSDRGHGRNALSQSLHGLREALEPDLILTRGNEEVGVDGDRLRCDALRFRGAMRRGDADLAHRLYRGDLLEGLHLADAHEWEEWVEAERHDLRCQAARASWDLAHREVRFGRVAEAERLAEEAVGRVCTDESEVQRFLEALADAGDRAAAVNFYQRFAERLDQALDLEPGPRTRALMDSIRSEGQTS
jgi:DNA-binding SARP family transcriptional activator